MKTKSLLLLGLCLAYWGCDSSDAPPTGGEDAGVTAGIGGEGGTGGTGGEGGTGGTGGTGGEGGTGGTGGEGGTGGTGGTGGEGGTGGTGGEGGMGGEGGTGGTGGTEPLTQCSDELDNDGDGLVDLADPGCADATDDNEGDDPAPLTCYERELIDLNAALEADGFYEGDLSTFGSSATQGSCGGGSGPEATFVWTTEVPLTRAVFSTEFAETVNPVVLYVREACEDTEDLACNRGSAMTPGTTITLDDVEAGSYLVFVDTGSANAGPGAFRLSVTAEGAPQCRDTLDNDGDGLIDLADPGCLEGDDLDETDPAEVPECADGVDNDGDGQTDYPNDPDCVAAGVTREASLCSAPYQEIFEVGQEGGSFNAIFPAGVATGYTDGSCATDSGPELVYHITLTEPSDVRVTSAQTGLPFAMYLRSACDDASLEVTCNDDLSSALTARNLAVGEYFLFVDAQEAIEPAEFPFIEIQVTSLITECNDEVDNDDDGLIDLNDPGCTGGRDTSEADPAITPLCADGVDNDDDMLIDYPEDTDCVAAGDNYERTLCATKQLTALINESSSITLDTTGLSNDHTPTECRGGNGPEAVIAIELSETSNVIIETVSPSVDTVLFLRRELCDDETTEVSCDDDGGDGNDSLIAVGALEPGLYFVFVDGYGTTAEGEITVNIDITPSVVPTTECNDEMDNDNDGLVDLLDPGCFNELSPSEVNPEPLSACGDGVDNDNDGATDTDDSDCFSAGDTSEEARCTGLPAREVTLDYETPLVVDVNPSPALPFGGERGSCSSGSSGRPDVIAINVPEQSDVTIDLDDPAGGDTAGRVFYVRSACDDATAEGELACVSTTNFSTSRSLPNLSAGVYYLFVERGVFFDEAPLTMTISAVSRVTECNDGVDNNANNLIDLFDLGCVNSDSPSESLAEGEPTPECADTLDNDGNGLSDYPNDPFCTAAGDTRERACAGVDVINVPAEGLVDYIVDPSLSADTLDSGCAFSTGNEVVFSVTLTERAAINVSATATDGDTISTYMNLRTECEDEDSELFCNSSSAPRVFGPVDPGTYLLVIERSSFNTLEPLKVNLSVQSLTRACGDGVDNDEDGLTDLNDPGCESSVDNNEEDPAFTPECSDGLDNDDDTGVDFFAEGGDANCVAAGDNTELGYCEVNEVVVVGPEGLTGFTFEPLLHDDNLTSECAFESGAEVVFAVEVPQLSNVNVNVNNLDGTNASAYVDLRTACDDDTTSLNCFGTFTSTRLFSRLEANTYYVIVERSASASPAPFTVDIEVESLVRACNDGEDNDGDGLIDFPNDPGCMYDMDDSEESPEVAPECADGIDNDGDNALDYADGDTGDVDCFSASDNTEAAVCDLVDAVQEISGSASFYVDTTNLTHNYTGACNNNSAPEAVIKLIVAQRSSLRVETISPDVDTLIYIRSGDCDEGESLDCDDDGGEGNDSLIDLNSVEPGEYFLFIDGFGNSSTGESLVVVDITPILPPVTECNDGVDNDEDNLVDLNDPGCVNSLSASETDPVDAPACSDGVDNDEDGAVDFVDGEGGDLDCLSAGDLTEDPRCLTLPSTDVAVGYDAETIVTLNPEARVDTTEVGTCANGDSVGQPAVVSFELPEYSDIFISAFDPSEERTSDLVVSVRAACDDAESELACANAFNLEGEQRVAGQLAGRYYVIVERTSVRDQSPVELHIRLESRVTECNDGVDNDNDDLIDLADYGCTSLDSPSETYDETQPPPVCADGLDNDDDGLIDYPEDPECSAAGGEFEIPICEQFLNPATIVPPEGGTFTFTPALDVDGDDYVSCGFSAGDVAAYLITLTELSRVSYTVTDEDGFESFVYTAIRSDCGDPESELNCESSFADYPRENDLEAGTYFLLVHRTASSTENPFDVAITITSLIGECNDGVDNDEDNLIDFPNDPGCVDQYGQSEVDPEVLPECADGLDNNEDGFIDYPNDLLCSSAGQAVEGFFCAGEADPFVEVSATGLIELDTSAAGADYNGSCSNAASAESVFVVRVAETSDVTLETIANHDTVLYVRESVCDGGDAAEIACNDDGGDGTLSLLTFTAEANVTYYVFVDGWSTSNTGAVTVDVQVTPTAAP